MRQKMTTIKIPESLKERIDLMKPITQSYAAFLTNLLTPVGDEYIKPRRMADYRIHELQLGESREVATNDLNEVSLLNNHLKYIRSKYNLDFRTERVIRSGILYIEVIRI